MFALKCLMKQNPYSVLTIAFLGLSTLFGFAVRVVERPFYEDEKTGRIYPDDDGY